MSVATKPNVLALLRTIDKLIVSADVATTVTEPARDPDGPSLFVREAVAVKVETPFAADGGVNVSIELPDDPGVISRSWTL